MKLIALVAACSALLAVPANVAAEQPGTAALCRAGTQVGSGSRPSDLATRCLLKRFPPSASAAKAVGVRYCADTWKASATWRALSFRQKSVIADYCLAHVGDWVLARARSAVGG